MSSTPRPSAPRNRRAHVAWRCIAGPTSFTISLIPETLARTTLGRRRPGDRVNLEVDILAKHVEKLLAAQLPSGQQKEQDA